MEFYAAFNSISVISWLQLTLFMPVLGFTSTRLGLWNVLLKDTPKKKPRGSSVARTQDPWITSQTRYHWATQDPDDDNLTFPKLALFFMCLQYKSFENTVGKLEIACNKQFLLFPQCFLPILRTFCYVHQIWNFCLQTQLSKGRV